MLVGQSAGAVNIAGLAARRGGFAASAAHLAAMWRGLRVPDIYRADAWSVGCRAALWLAIAATGGWATRRPISFLDNTPLRALLQSDLDFDALREALASGALRAVAMSASSYGRESGLSVTFFEGAGAAWAEGRRRGAPARLGVEHVMASSALPFLFPSEKLDDCWFGDGALRLNAPLSPAIALGAERLFVIAARDPEIAPQNGAEPAGAPSLGALAGHMLDVIFNDDLDADLARLERLNRAVAAMAPEAARRLGLRRVDAFTLRPSRDLREIAGRHPDPAPAARPRRLARRLAAGERPQFRRGVLRRACRARPFGRDAAGDGDPSLSRRSSACAPADHERVTIETAAPPPRTGSDCIPLRRYYP